MAKGYEAPHGRRGTPCVAKWRDAPRSLAPDTTTTERAETLEALAARIRACRICVDTPAGRPLPHPPRPVLQVSATARLMICGQAPGLRADAAGKPFADPSGVRLRAWLGIDDEVFYDASRIAIVPMGFCFPGYDTRGADRPPRSECAPAWRTELLAAMPQIELALLIGQHAQRWHLGPAAGGGLTSTVRGWRELMDEDRRPRLLPLPHPSWRNNRWLKDNGWFEADVVPALRAEVARLVDRADPAGPE